MAGERRLPGLGLYGFWTQGTAWKAGADENWLRLSALVQGAVLSRTTALPTSPADGAVYIVPPGATNAGKVAVRDNGAWTYLDPRAGIRMFVADTGKFVFHDGSVWKEEDASAVFSFLALTDTPKAFGAPGQLLAVDPEGDALVFVDAPSAGGGGTVLPPFTNNQGKVLAVNAAGDGVEWIDPAEGGGGANDHTPGTTWRLSVTAIGDPAFGVSLATFHLIDADGVKIDTSSATVTATDFSSGFEPARALDSDESTIYVSNLAASSASPVFLQIVFPAPVNVASIRMTPRTDRSPVVTAPTDFTVSADGAVVLTKTGVSWPTASVQSFPLDELTAGGGGAGGIEEAPEDGKGYVRKDGAWAEQASGGGGDPLAEGKLSYPLNYAAYRYYRITSKVVGGSNSYQGLGDFDLREKSGVEGPTPEVLSVSINGGPAAANLLANWFDGNVSSAYELSGNPVFTFVLDFGVPKTFVELNMVSPWPNEVPNDLLIEGSNDNAAFLELEHQQFAGLNTSPVTRTLTPKVGGTGYIGLAGSVAGKAGQALVISGDGTSIETVSATDFLKPGGTAGKHRYWRTLFTYANPAGGRNDYVSIAELEWRQEVGGSPQGEATNAFASGSYSTNNPPGLTQDRNAATFWESQSGSQTAGTIWLGMDFLEPVPLAEIMLQKSTTYPDENPFGVAVQWSNDKIDWTTAHTFETGFSHTVGGSSITVQMPGFAPTKTYLETDGEAVKMEIVTQAEYDAITEKKATTLYLVPEA